MNFANIKAITIPEGKVSKILSGDSVLWSAGLLPSAYQQVEYVQADADVGAYIDLGFAFDTAATVYMTQYPESITAAYPFGATNADGGIRCCISCPYSGAAAHTYGCNDSTYISVSVDIKLALYNEIKAVWKNGYLHSTNLSTSVEGKTLTTQTAYAMTEPLYLFAQNYKGSPRFGGMRRISKFQYYDKNDVLVCDLVPCYRKSDGVIGMYDAVRRQFFTNVGTGTFTKGPGVSNALLPSGYQRVDYIATDGNQIIDTLVIPSDHKDGIWYELDFRSNWSGSLNSNDYVWGCLSGSSRSGNLYYNRGAGNSRLICGTTSGGITYKWYDVTERTVVRAFATSEDTSSLYLEYEQNGEVKNPTINNSIYDTAPMPSESIYLFNCRGISRQGTPIVCYGFNMKAADKAPIRSFVPCYRKADGVIGLYDTVEGGFYTNIGTGSFTKGADV